MRSRIYFATAALISIVYFFGKYQINGAPTQTEISQTVNKNSGGKFAGSKRPETVRQQFLVTKKIRSPKQLISQRDRKRYIKKVAKNWTDLASKMHAKFKQDNAHFSPENGAVNVKQNKHHQERTNEIVEQTDNNDGHSINV